MSKKSKPNEIYIYRIYNAPVKTVWEAWVDPKKVAQWWGPRGFTLTTVSKDVRTGGSWIYTMHGPDGVDYPNVTQYLEVEKYSRMVYDHGANEKQSALFRVTVEFSETKDGNTKMEMWMALPTPEAATETKKFIKKARGNSTWDRLAEYLSAKDIFVINRSFQAPIETVFEMWTNPKHISRWLAPTGFEMSYINEDIRPGGSAFYSMQHNDGLKMFGKMFYKKIDAPNELVYTQIFCDENGNVSRHPMAPTWPETMLTKITFITEEPNVTLVTISWEIHGDATKIEKETFHNAKSGMTDGWTGSFDKFENYILTK